MKKEQKIHYTLLAELFGKYNKKTALMSNMPGICCEIDTCPPLG